MKKYLFGIVVIILCVACAIWVYKGRASEVSKEGILPKDGQAQSSVQTKPVQHPLYSPNTIVVSNGVIVADMREKVPPSSPDYESYLLERKKIAEHGMDAKVTLHVVDQDGKDVPNADINVHFSCNNRRNEAILGKTDIKGCFTATDRLTGEIIYIVTKEGYYRTRSIFRLMQRDIRSFENGRWIPWNPTLLVTLKEIRKPIQMHVKKVEFKLPEKAQKMGFDFLVGDWVPPHGKGITADMIYLYEEERTDRDNFDVKLSVTFPGKDNGCYVKSKDEFSTLISDHEARPDNYASNMVWQIYRKSGQYVKKERLTKNDYLVFRTRSRCDEKGDVISANYGKLYGPLEGPDGLDRMVSFIYYFNPTPNDRNLEFDGKNNLFKDPESLEEVYNP
jgi:hypothetical protein